MLWHVSGSCIVFHGNIIVCILHFCYFYSVHNTLYLELHCPAVRPDLVVISDSGRSTLDFGQCSIGQTLSKQVTIQNISPKTIDVSFLYQPMYTFFSIIDSCIYLSQPLSTCYYVNKIFS